jgi:membrane protease YdiL (CAAX protease family)
LEPKRLARFVSTPVFLFLGPLGEEFGWRGFSDQIL